jgi:hypothetical protein
MLVDPAGRVKCRGAVSAGGGKAAALAPSRPSGSAVRRQCVRAGPLDERLDRHVDRGGADRLVEIEVVVGTGQLDVLDRRTRARAHPLDELAHI